VKLNTYQELLVWQKAMDLVEAVYKASSGFPRDEIYGLTSQIRKAAVSLFLRMLRKVRVDERLLIFCVTCP